ncbi:MAG: hypothetical protein B6D34_01550 [Candidatus Brocadia sp. UTAMX1]|jgi:hypothetical protein|nr:MAG: hypothetical protein B6D34_01550 [Candidatus Brocadia sp. UTAMX1]
MSYKANGKDCQRCPHLAFVLHLGYGRRITRTREELSLLSTGFNIARMITLVGIPALIVKLQGM